MKFYLIPVLMVFLSCVAHQPAQNNVFPLMNGECDYLKKHYKDHSSVHITKQVVNNQLKCVVDFYIQVEDQIVPIKTSD